MARKATSSSKQARALEVARKRRLELDAERRVREERVDELVARFVVAGDARAESVASLESVIAESDISMGQIVRDLMEMGESTSRIAALLAVTPSEVRRLSKLGAAVEGTSAGLISEDIESMSDSEVAECGAEGQG